MTVFRANCHLDRQSIMQTILFSLCLTAKYPFEFYAFMIRCDRYVHKLQGAPSFMVLYNTSNN